MKWLFACVVLAAIAFVAGAYVGRRSMLGEMKVQLDSVQASLAFNRLVEERAWQSLLARGCVTQAQRSLDIAVDQEMGLLADLYKAGLDPSTIKYISDRDPLLEEQLKAFKSRYGSKWLEQECKG